MSNSLDPDQDRHSLGPDLGPTCLQRLYTDDKSHRCSKERVNNEIKEPKVNEFTVFYPKMCPN